MKTDRPNTEPMALATGSPRNVLIGVLGCDGDAFGKRKKLGDRRASPEASVYGLGVRSAFTLIEAMIAITMTLIIMLALAQGFKRLSDDISQGRARLALSDQLRSVSEVLRNDLANLTVDPDPTSPNNKLGYFMYYDGPVTDYTAATLPINTTVDDPLIDANATTEQRLSASKYGDFDDILMFTAKANGGYFKGRVPLAVVKGKAAFQAELVRAATPPYPPFDYTNVTSAIAATDWNNSVVIASEFAEISYFMMPLLNSDTPILLPSDVRNVNDVPNIVDTEVPVRAPSSVNVSNYGSSTVAIPDDMAAQITGNGVPDQFVLCRRVLLIVPDLNITIPAGTSVPGYTANGETSLYYSGLSNDQLFADAYTTAPSLLDRRVSPFDLMPGEKTAMRNAYQRCDLSVKRVKSPTNNGSPVAANSLSDLADPSNRFAHTMLSSGSNTSMPVLSLTSPIAIQRYAVKNTVNLKHSANIYANSGFMRPEFLRQKFTLSDHDDDPTTPDVWVGVIDGSEFLAMNCIAFDLKGFDPGARFLYHRGNDSLPIINAVTQLSDIPVMGASGTDDLVLGPNDPGYDDSINYMNIANPSSGPPNFLRENFLAAVTASRGMFVDIGWGPKKLNSIDSTKSEYFLTPLSGIAAVGSPLSFSTSLIKSGRIVISTVAPPAPAPPASVTSFNVYQPCFDSFTDAFENDGFNQLNSISGTIFLSGISYLNGNPPPTTLPSGADLAVNGLDDELPDTLLPNPPNPPNTPTPANGVIDDFNERDSSPPINFAMPAIQATIRLEDKQASVIQQIAVTQSLINP